MAKEKRDVLVPVEEQPHPIPENWQWVKMGGITQIIGGGTPSSGKEEYYKDGTIPWISPADLSGFRDIYISHGSKYITALGLQNSSARLMPKDTVCLSTRAPIGYVAIAQNPLATNQGFKSFLPASCYIPHYLYWYLKGNKHMLDSMASGTTFLELSGSKAATIKFPLPPLPEQRRIVDRVESLFAKLDEAKEKAQTVVDGFEDRKAAILHKAFTGKLTAEWRKDHGLSLKTWRIVELHNCSTEIGDGLHGTPSYDNDGRYYFINGNNLEKDHIEIKTDTKTVDYSEYEKHFIQLSKEKTVLVSINGTLGRTAFYNNEPVILGKSACYINVNDLLSKYYLRFYFETQTFINYANDKATGSTIKNLGLKAMRSMPISLPTMDEQMEIVRRLDRFISNEEEAYKTAEKVISQIETMKKAILVRAFRGELGTNDPTELPADIGIS